MNIDSIQTRLRSHKYRLANRLFLALLASFFVSSLTMSLGAMIDGFIVAQTQDPTVVGAVSLVNPLAFLFALIGGVVGSGFEHSAAQELSRGNIEKGSRMFSLAITAGVSISIVVAIIIIVFSNQITVLLGADPGRDVFGPCRSYLIGSALGLPSMTLVLILEAAALLEGARIRRLSAVAALTAINIIGNLICVNILETGLFSLAFTTTISYTAAAVLLALYFYKRDTLLTFKLVRVDLHDLKHMSVHGMPQGVNRLTTAWRGAFINNVLAAQTTAIGLAAYNVQVQVNYITSAFFVGIAQALVLLICIYYTEEDREAVQRVAKIAIRLELLVGGVLTLLFLLPGVEAFLARLYLGANVEDVYTVTLAKTALFWFGIGLLGQGIVVAFAHYLLGTGHVMASNLVYLLDEVVFTFIAVTFAEDVLHPGHNNLLLLTGTFAGVSLAHVFTVATIPIFLLVINRKFRLSFDWLLMLPDTFGSKKGDEIGSSLQSIDDVMDYSKKVWDFCVERGVSDKQTYFMSLAVEEMGRNVIEYGFRDKKAHVLEIRVSKKNDDLILRLRDDCKPFNPKKAYEKLYNNEDPTSMIGIRMINSMAKEFSYTSTLRVNNLIIRI